MIALFVLANVIIARFLERRKMHFAVVFHSVVFVVMLCAFAFYDANNPVSFLAQRLLGQTLFLRIRAELPFAAHPGGVIVSLLLFDISLLLTEIFALFLLVKGVAKLIVRARKRLSFAKVGAPKLVNVGAEPCALSNKIYLRNCTLLC